VEEKINRDQRRYFLMEQARPLALLSVLNREIARLGRAPAPLLARGALHRRSSGLLSCK